MNDAHLCLWNTPAFFALRGAEAAQYLRVDHHEPSGRLVGSWVGGVEGDRFVSGWSAPFAGPDFVREDEGAGNVVALLRAGFEDLRQRGIARAELRLKPPHYGEAGTHVLFALLMLGADVVEANVNYVMDVEGVASGEAWMASLKKEARKAYARVHDVATATVTSADEETWAAAYDVLRENRESRGRPMRLPYAYVCAIRGAFPDKVRLVVARTADGAVCAAALLYRVAPGRDVVQYWGDAHHDLPSSPMPALVAAVVGDAVATGARTIDVGIATDGGQPNLGLMQFKRTMGAAAELRVIVAADVEATLASPMWQRLRG